MAWLGNGTIDDPYQITTVEELIATTESTVHYYYKLMNDLDLSAYDPWITLWNAPGGRWIGSLDGNNKSINNLIIKSGSFINIGMPPFYEYAGLFANLNLEMTESAYIKNLYINNVLILFDSYSAASQPAFAGVLCARNSRRNISNVHINNYTCSVIIQPGDNGEFMINTLGDTYESTVYSCSVSNSRVEIIAANDNLNVFGIRMLGSIDTTDSWSQCFISDCYMKSDVWWSDYSSPIDGVFVSPFGHIYGYAKDMYVANTIITSSNQAVGLCTYLLYDVSIQNVYTSVNFGNTPPSNIYPIAQYVGGKPAINCYYESGSYVFDTDVNVLGFTGLTTAQMKNSASYLGWDFDTIWRIDNV